MIGILGERRSSLGRDWRVEVAYSYLIYPDQSVDYICIRDTLHSIQGCDVPKRPHYNMTSHAKMNAASHGD